MLSVLPTTRRLLVIAGFWSSLLPSLPAGVLYVATDGDDSTGDGSSGAPWATLTKATDEAADGDTILVRPGTYFGRQRLRGQWETGITVRSELPYRARLRHNATVVTCYYGQNITLEGFDIAHDGPGAGGLVIQVQNLLTDSDPVQGIVIRDNVIHDSYNNDLLKINNGATDIAVLGNLFYNQEGSDEHIDINSVDGVLVEGNVFFNDFAGSGRPDDDTSSFVVVKDSNGASDAFTGARDVTLRRNIMLHYIGSAGSNFILFGEDGTANHEAYDCLVENNLLIGDSSDTMRAPFGVKGCRDITFRNNTVVGDLPSNAFAMRLNREGANPQLENIHFFNNIWCDPTGTMGDFSDTPPDDTVSFRLENNLYWNGGTSIPSSPASDLVNYTDDPGRIVGSPSLINPTGIVLPRWQEGASQFAGGAETIDEVFHQLASTYGVPGEGSAAIDAADPAEVPTDDLFGNLRPVGGGADVGAVEFSPIASSDYVAWIGQFFPGSADPETIAFGADPDRDGISNGVEYGAMPGAHPGVPDAQGATVQLSSTDFEVVRRSSDLALATGLFVSEDLGSWVPMPESATGGSAPDGFVRESYPILSGAGGAEPRRFFQYRFWFQAPEP